MYMSAGTVQQRPPSTIAICQSIVNSRDERRHATFLGALR